MKFIKVSSVWDNSPIYINVEHIGHFCSVPEKIEYGRVSEPAYTTISVTTHNNGGFKVKESVEEIIEHLEINQ